MFKEQKRDWVVRMVWIRHVFREQKCDWMVRIRIHHVFREQNRATDFLAKEFLKYRRGQQGLGCANGELCQILRGCDGAVLGTFACFF